MNASGAWGEFGVARQRQDGDLERRHVRMESQDDPLVFALAL